MEEYVKDPRIACKYGVKCYQRNPLHHQKYKHPPKIENDSKPKITRKDKAVDQTDRANEDSEEYNIYSVDTDTECNKDSDNTDSETTQDNNESEAKRPRLDTISEKKRCSCGGVQIPRTVRELEVDEARDIIKSKFLIQMPDDFYEFWKFCKQLRHFDPVNAFKQHGLTLVGPYDVLAGKYSEYDSDETYWLHWRYYYDPPEFITVLKGDDNSGYHIGYFRDVPGEHPVFLASNCANKDGRFTIMGDNIFAAVNLYLDEYKKTCDPYSKCMIGNTQQQVRKEADRLRLKLSATTPPIERRNEKLLSRTFNKLGFIVPYNSRTQLGYRPLAVTNRQLERILNLLKTATDEEQPKILAQFQPIITAASIALDECDFGTGLELGLDILASGVECVNETARRFLCNSYNLLGRDAFAKIAETHLKNRKKGCDLNMLKDII